MGRIAVRGELSLDGSGWDKTMRSAGSQLDHFATNTLGNLKGQIAAAFSIGAIVAFSKSLIESAAHIKDLSEQTGLTTDNVQRLAAAAKMVGLEFDDVATALSRMGAIRKAAAQGDKEALKTLEDFGIAYGDIQNAQKSNLDLLDQLSSKTGKLNAAQREQLRSIFGRGGDKMGAVANALNAGNVVPMISTKDIDNLDRFSKINARIWQDIKTGASTRFAEVITAIFTGRNKIEKADAAERALQDIFGISPETTAKWRTVPRSAPAGMQDVSRGEYINKAGGVTSAGEPASPLFPGHFKYDIEANNAKIAAEYKQPKSKGLASDSLVRVGNFLGDAPRLVQIAEMELTLAQKNNIALTNIESNTRGLSVNQSGLGF